MGNGTQPYKQTHTHIHTGAKSNNRIGNEEMSKAIAFKNLGPFVITKKILLDCCFWLYSGCNHLVCSITVQCFKLSFLIYLFITQLNVN